VGSGLSISYRAVAFNSGHLRLLDQTALPGRERYLAPRSAAEVVRAIRRLAVRGAPSIGVAAGYGMAVEARRLSDRHLRSGLEQAAARLVSARPTAVNLAWAVERIRAVVRLPGLSPSRLRSRVVAEARRIEADEIARSVAIAEHGEKLVPTGGVVLTICNTGPLAAPGLGTALGIILHAHATGKRPRVFACETRPLLQGSRLTTWELTRLGVPVTLIVDSAAASVVDDCDLVVVGADRVAANGDTANKVGTLMLAALARRARRPFWVAAPSSSFDRSCLSGADIPVEERDAAEVRAFRGCRAALGNVAVFNPAFDVTPASLITGFITEHGIVRRPFRRRLGRMPV
jgi:methylthioribose-1-phosphate isomerase